tara:strand:+ start:345 stop:668 length:324 start_codon:yes stop_codon:yes gene_type:complete
MTEDRGLLKQMLKDQEKYISEIKKDNLLLAKEVDRLNEYVQVMELENDRKKNRSGWDGRSRPSSDLYSENYDRIFKTNPVAKEVRTPKYKSQVIKSKKIYNRKKEER